MSTSSMMNHFKVRVLNQFILYRFSNRRNFFQVNFKLMKILSPLFLDKYIIQEMKQNQYLYRLVPGEKPETKHHDFLSIKAHCNCYQCERISETVNPQIKLDEQLILLKKNNKKIDKICDHVFFLNHLKKSDKNLPRFKFLDTIVTENGMGVYAIYFQQGKLKIVENVSIKDWILKRKQLLDIQYQIKKHERETNFCFTAFEHKCEKKIKEFQNNITYKIPAVLNKIAIVKLKGIENEVILSKTQFLDLFDVSKNRVYDIKDIEYIQVFPIMCGEQENSYVKEIKYFREKESIKKGFKLAQAYVLTWKEKNDSLQKLQQKVYQQILESTSQKNMSLEDQLSYQTYKLLIYFEEMSNIRVEEAIVHYITNDTGKTYFFKKIEYIKTEERISIDQLGTELPTKKEIAVEDHINLKNQMRNVFEGFQLQFDRLNREQQQMENRVKKDKQYSNFVFKTISSGRVDNFHDVLLSRKLRYKKQQLNL